METVKNRNFSAIRNQVLATLVANICMCGYGIYVGWFSPTLVLVYQSNETTSPLLSGELSTADASWIGSVLCLGTAAGTLFFGYLANYTGTKDSLSYCSFLLMIGWIIVKFAQYPWHLICSRFIVGLSSGCLFLNISLFVAEISDDYCRGALGSTVLIFCETGILIGYVMGTYLPYTVSPMIAIAFPIVFFICFIFFPSTPKHLLRQGKIDKAYASLKFYRNSKYGENDTEIVLEFEKLKEVTAANKAKSLKISDFLTAKVGKAFLVGMTLLAVSELSGSFTMVNYAGSIFQASGSDIDPNESSFYLGAIQIVGTIATLCLIDKIGRKILLIISTIGLALGTAVAGLYSYYYTRGVNLNAVNFIPVVSLSFAIFVASIGIIPIPYILAAELFPPKVRQTGATICVISVGLFGFLMLKLYPLIEKEFNLYGAMIVFSVVALLGAIFTYLVVDETKGKNLDTVDDSSVNGKTNEQNLDESDRII